MPTTADAQGWIRCRGYLPDGSPCCRVLWRVSRDGRSLTLHDPKLAAGAVEILVQQLPGLTHTCPTCRTVWRPTILGPAAPPPRPRFADVPEPLRTRLLNPPRDGAAAA